MKQKTVAPFKRFASNMDTQHMLHMSACVQAAEGQARSILDLLPSALKIMRTTRDGEVLERALFKAKWRLEQVDAHDWLRTEGTRMLITELDLALSTLEVAKTLCDPVPAPRLL